MHLRGRFDRDTAGVEGDALADQCHLRCSWTALAAAMGHPHQPGWVHRALTDADDAAEATAGQSFLIEHFHLQTGGRTPGLGPVRELLGVEMTGWCVDQIAGRCHRRGDGSRAGGLPLGVGGGAQRDDAAQTRFLGCGLRAAELVHLIGAQDQTLHGGRQVQGAQGGDDRLNPRQGPRRRARGPADRLGRPLLSG